MKNRTKNKIAKIAEIVIIIWAVGGILLKYRSYDLFQGYDYHITPVIAYFLSATLMLYFLRKKNYVQKEV